MRPNLFDDLSMIRMGREVDDISQIMHAKGDFRIGVSSPKRYLWADDDSWLEGAFWYMADPHDRVGTGPSRQSFTDDCFKYLHEDDRDFLLDNDDPPEEMFARGAHQAAPRPARRWSRPSTKCSARSIRTSTRTPIGAARAIRPGRAKSAA